MYCSCMDYTASRYVLTSHGVDDDGTITPSVSTRANRYLHSVSLPKYERDATQDCLVVFLFGSGTCGYQAFPEDDLRCLSIYFCTLD